ncbi:hypothetical protein H257_16476 [Aphanomyces astaci]|uniref:Uncharacterized protein n=1 Tax=Aphanomyces astaci TaxID=112090 RepID=W4FKH7_APHAT|nr:hypothetical protein H257_16476 [Aphanomyces astaci]ETV67223.1 hypothetical protein H257_16476 [Aphanomyces astaci]|eukprot:XP_009843211.1 hypothetical protein H257_16476 [Aphanomyces astaci]
MGPYRVIKVVSNHLIEVQQLTPPEAISLQHVSRLRMYCEGGLEVDEDLKAQIAFGDEGSTSRPYKTYACTIRSGN